MGTAKLLKDKSLPPDKLIDMVSSKGGTTERGMQTLTESDINNVIEKTVESATERSKELNSLKEESQQQQITTESPKKLSNVEQIVANAKKGSHSILNISSADKELLLVRLVENLKTNKSQINIENKKDLENAKKKGLSEAFIQRLEVTDKVFDEMIDGIKTIIELEDPNDRILEEKQLANGLNLKKVSVPLGVVLIIYESRPNVTLDVSTICIKSGNAVILKGGSDAINTNRAIYNLIKKSFKDENLDPNVVQFVDSTDHAMTDELLEQKDIDVVIPRGGKELIKKVSESSSIPIIKHDDGICTIYVDEDADPYVAMETIVNAKCQKPSACNAVENVLVHKEMAESFLPLIFNQLKEQNVEVRGCPKTKKHIECKDATEEDWKTEYLDKIISIKIVENIDEAITFINTYGSKHSDAIISQDENNVKKFFKEVDSACLYHNASTRFTDGGQFGMGCEMGISTQKLHARGPVALKEMTSYKWLIEGDGQVRD